MKISIMSTVPVSASVSVLASSSLSLSLRRNIVVGTNYVRWILYVLRATGDKTFYQLITEKLITLKRGGIHRALHIPLDSATTYYHC